MKITSYIFPPSAPFLFASPCLAHDPQRCSYRGWHNKYCRLQNVPGNSRLPSELLPLTIRAINGNTQEASFGSLSACTLPLLCGMSLRAIERGCLHCALSCLQYLPPCFPVARPASIMSQAQMLLCNVSSYLCRTSRACQHCPQMSMALVLLMFLPSHLFTSLLQCHLLLFPVSPLFPLSCPFGLGLSSKT